MCCKGGRSGFARLDESRSKSTIDIEGKPFVKDQESQIKPDAHLMATIAIDETPEKHNVTLMDSIDESRDKFDAIVMGSIDEEASKANAALMATMNVEAEKRNLAQVTEMNEDLNEVDSGRPS